MNDAPDVGLVLDLYRNTVAPVARRDDTVLEIVLGVLSDDLVELGINALSGGLDISADLSQIARRVVTDFVLGDNAAPDLICSRRYRIKPVKEDGQDIIRLVLPLFPSVGADEGSVLEELADLKQLADAQRAAELEAQERGVDVEGVSERYATFCKYPPDGCGCLLLQHLYSRNVRQRRDCTAESLAGGGGRALLEQGHDFIIFQCV